jgi:signal transduction histidine kinase
MTRLWIRLSLAFLLVAGSAIASTAVIVRLTTEASFRHYVEQRNTDVMQGVSADALESYYAENSSWAGVEQLLPGPKSDGQGQGRGRNAERGAQSAITDASGIVVASTNSSQIGARIDTDSAIPLTVNGEQVGWLLQITPSTQILGETEQDFLDSITRQFAVIGGAIALAALAVGVTLSWQIARPLRALTEAAEDLRAGQLGRQVIASGSAELSELAAAFNSMSHDLAAGEQLRQRMAADIAHELRTPVSVLRGHLEAMLDGVFPLDMPHLAVAHDQTLHLARLVEDLRLLTQAQAGRLPLEKQSIAPADLVLRAVDHFQPLATDAAITLIHEVETNLPTVDADADRIRQVLANLLANALRHTPENGAITIRATRDTNAVRFSVSNSGSALTRDQLERLFEPFWRADEARERDQGGAGLGLAIAQQLVILHGGKIWAESANMRTTFAFTLPFGPAKKAP